MKFWIKVLTVILPAILAPFAAADEPQAPPTNGGSGSASTGTSNTACPTFILAQIPQGSNQTICLWELTNCVDETAVATIYSNCDATPCACENQHCNCDGSGPVYTPGTEVVIEEVMEGATGNGRLIVNRSVPQRTIPSPSLLVPAAAASPIMPWGQGDWKVAYLKTLKLDISASDTEYLALFKVFKQTEANPNGQSDVDTDKYIGLRVSGLPAEPRSVVTLDYDDAEKVKKLDLTLNNVRMEAGAKVTVTLTDAGGNSVDVDKWFHLYGIYR